MSTQPDTLEQARVDYARARAALNALGPTAGPAGEVVDAERRLDLAARALADAYWEATDPDEAGRVHGARMTRDRFLALLSRISGEFAEFAREVDEIRRAINVAGGSPNYAGEAERVLHRFANLLPNAGLDRLPTAAAEADRYR